MARSAASCARWSPAAVAVPIMAVPRAPITVFKSSKSTLIKPGVWMISAMPLQAL